MHTVIYKVDPVNPSKDIIDKCIEVLKRGGLVVFPTETVYGLGANTFDSKAVIKIFEVKGRPADNPLIVHISNLNQLEDVAVDIPEVVFKLSEVFWPGPLTVVLKKNLRVPDEVTAKLKTVAVRMPAHPVALKLAEIPIAAPSANIAGKPSPTTAEHVIRDLYGKVDVIIDAGETLYGVESTIIDLTRKPPVLLRPGALPVEKIEEIIGEIEIPRFARGLGEADKALSPGMKYRHYAPNTALLVVETNDYSNLDEYAKKFESIVKDLSKSKRIAVITSRELAERIKIEDVKCIVLGSRKNPYELCKNLFKSLRRLDELSVDLGVIEGFEEKGLGLTLMNRIRKASGFNILKI